MGKGSKPRPLSVPKRVFDRRWERTFSRRENPYIDKEYAKRPEIETGKTRDTKSPLFSAVCSVIP